MTRQTRWYGDFVALVDVVIVSYNSREQLRRCISPVLGDPDTHVVIVDNASADRSLELTEGLEVTAIGLDRNGGFAVGCNVGWRAGEAPYVLFLNPDAVIDVAAIRRLVAALEQDERFGAVGPKILESDGELDFSRRYFPRLRSTYAQALFLHRFLPRAAWADEIDRRSETYEVAGPAEWISGACMLFRRTVLEELGGLDEGFFMYCEDKDLCRRTWDAGYAVRYEPDAVAVHAGGASAPRARLLPVLAASKIRYAAKHRRLPAALAERAGIALGSATHMIVSRGGRSRRSGHLRALLVAAGVSQPALRPLDQGADGPARHA
jgi:N-acetylglucosaminyl-diphospho-decaprenol L-rhamnosyltransferase